MSEIVKRGETNIAVGMGWVVRWETSEHWLDFKAYAVVSEETEPVKGRRWFWQSGLGTAMVEHLDEVEIPDITGYVKWDGCSEMKLDQPHFCGAGDVADFAKVLVEIHKLALEVPAVDYDCAGYPDPRTEAPQAKEGR